MTSLSSEVATAAPFGCAPLANKINNLRRQIDCAAVELLEETPETFVSSLSKAEIDTLDAIRTSHKSNLPLTVTLFDIKRQIAIALLEERLHRHEPKNASRKAPSESVLSLVTKLEAEM